MVQTATAMTGLQQREKKLAMLSQMMQRMINHYSDRRQKIEGLRQWLERMDEH